MAGTKPKQHSGAALHERYQEAANGAVKSASKKVGSEASKVLQGLGSEAWAQLLGIDRKKHASKQAETPQHVEQKPQPGVTIDIVNFLTGGPVSAEKHSSVEKPKARVEAAMHYGNDVLKTTERANRQELTELQRNIQEIQHELRKLLSSSKVLQMEFNEVAVENATPEIGQYHMNFFEWMLLVIRQAREKVEDSGAWLNTVKGKGAKKNGYWGMFKKHGTSFGLSSERSTATQTG